MITLTDGTPVERITLVNMRNGHVSGYSRKGAFVRPIRCLAGSLDEIRKAAEDIIEAESAGGELQCAAANNEIPAAENKGQAEALSSGDPQPLKEDTVKELPTDTPEQEKERTAKRSRGPRLSPEVLRIAKVEQLARIIHESGRQAVEQKKVYRNDLPVKPFAEWDELHEDAREGRRMMARFLIDHAEDISYCLE